MAGVERYMYVMLEYTKETLNGHYIVRYPRW